LASLSAKSANVDHTHARSLPQLGFSCMTAVTESKIKKGIIILLEYLQLWDAHIPTNYYFSRDLQLLDAHIQLNQSRGADNHKLQTGKMRVEFGIGE
jgi:hypothetical protein